MSTMTAGRATSAAHQAAARRGSAAEGESRRDMPWAPPNPIGAALRLVPTLTPREHVTFELLGLGFDNRTIARTMQISERTAKRYVSAILKKLRLQSRLQAGLVALMVSSCSPAGGHRPESRIDSAGGDS